MLVTVTSSHCSSCSSSAPAVQLTAWRVCTAAAAAAAAAGVSVNGRLQVTKKTALEPRWVPIDSEEICASGMHIKQDPLRYAP